MKSLWENILKTAIHIPSPHNVQPWLVKISGEHSAELFIDSGRTLPKEDVTGSFIILTMGMFIEALSILAERQGFKLTYDLIHEPEQYAKMILALTKPKRIPFAKLELHKQEVIDNLYDEQLFLKRRTSRLKLLDKLIPNHAIKSLEKIAGQCKQKFSTITNSDAIEKLLEWDKEALFEDLNTPSYRDEIVEWFRFSDKQSSEHLDGLDYRCMNTSRMTFWMTARMSFLMQMPVSKQILAKIYRSQIGNVPTLGVISGNFWEPADAINTGRFLVRFWLETAVQNLYIHPFGNLVTNRKIAALVEKELGISDIWLVFKIGYSDIPPKSHRLPLDKIIID